ncbi:amino acid adenylation domain-containing protein [Paenibacillus sp. SC116]|uniref:non-ribosomal peptide synthetase n=1 Tax=Paenibacillus sp. SC116 TaxID=2968986 RepID=UPI00215AC8BB|nr:amino acid adenylation domain-containing protein [Paenibacillus sp. SC116]MCR8844350.1 amino acid adenylation domain-containing protein [Paenibacillus sp. SC116]
MRETQSNLLDKENVEDIIALTPMQEGLLFHYRSDKDKGHYTQQFSMRLVGNYSVERYKKAWHAVARANDVLRTVYRWEKLVKPVQIVLKEKEIPIEVHDFSSYPREQAETLVAELKAKDRHQELDIGASPLRIGLCLLDSETSETILTWHHILFDGWSNGILLKAFMQAYQALCDGTDIPLNSESIKTPFKHYVQLQQRQDKGEQRQYWEQELAGWQERTRLVEPSELLFDRDDRDGTGDSGSRYKLGVSVKTAQQMNRYTQQHKVTLAALLYTTWGVLLGRYCQTEDVLFGTTVSGRPPELAGVEEMIGLFINTIPLRMRWQSDELASQVVKAVDEQIKRRVDVELTPLVDIHAYSGADHYEPLFNTIMVIENYPLDTSIGQTGALQIEHYAMEESTHYGMTIGVQLLGTGDIELEFAYDASCFSGAMVERLAGHYKQIVEQICENSELLISEIGLLNGQEREQQLYTFNRKPSPASNTEHEEADTLQARYERIAEQFPDRIAIRCGEQSYTFAEINVAANRLAHRLSDLGVHVDEPIAIWLERSEQLIVAVLAVLKTGAAYVPIDYEYAPGRINQMLEDCQATKLVAIDDRLPESILFAGTIVNVRGHSDEHAQQSMQQRNDESNLPHRNKSDDAAYILYTSGTTGTPKGVVVEHRNVLAYVDAFQHEFQLTENDICLLQASFSFDQFVEEMYPVLLAGGHVVIANKMDVIDIPKLIQLIDIYQITIVSVSPLMLNELNTREGMESVRTFISGGDVLKPEYISSLLGRANVYNTYGPTEATVCAAYHRCSAVDSARGSIPIGKPILNYRVYVLDRYGHPLPIGVPGEICIAGAGVARGYLNRAELTARFYAVDPFYADGRMYRTGDVGIWLSDGSLQYVGRNDHQVKIRGYRVELGDIEYRLLTHTAVDGAVVLAHQDEHGMMSLAAYVKTNKTITANELREALALSLPAYMIPASFYHIENIPTTSNNKLDRKALLQVSIRLPNEHAGYSMTDHDASETEQNIRRVWQEVLKLEYVGLNDHFFDLGGNSILLMQLHAKLEKENAWGIEIVDLFTYSTVARLAKWIDERQSGSERDDDALRIDYQQLPADVFHRQWHGAGIGNVRFHLQSNLREQVIAIAEGAQVSPFDVLSGMVLYLFSEWNEKPHASIQCLQEGGEQVISLSVDMGEISGFEELFHYVHQVQVSGAVGQYALHRIAPEQLKKAEDEILPLIYHQQDIEIDSTLLESYDMAWGIEEQDEEQLSISIKFNDKRMKKEAIQMLANGYVDLLRQLAASRVMS